MGVDRTGAGTEPYYVSYPVVSELLGDNGYRLWGVVE